MDEEIDGLFENSIAKTRATIFKDYINFENIFLFLMVTTCWVGIVIDLLAVWILFRNKCLRPRTNTLVLLLFLHSALLLLTETSYAGVFSWSNAYQMPALYCMKRHVVPTNQMIMCAFVLLLLSHTVMNTKKISTRTILAFVYTQSIIYGVYMVVRCVKKEYTNDTILGGYVSLFIFVYMIIATIVKDINRCCRNRFLPLSDDAKFRLDIARIYIYNSFVCFVIYMVSFCTHFFAFFYVINILYLSVYLPPLYIFIYTYRTNEVFRRRTLDIVKCNFKRVEGEIKYVKSGVETCTNEDGIVINFATAETNQVPQV